MGYSLYDSGDGGGEPVNQQVFGLAYHFLRNVFEAQAGREAGEFHWLHYASVDSRGNIYTAEVDTGKRAQKFVNKGRS